MRTTKLGDLTVSAQGLGCMGMSEWYGATDWDESIATINRALDLGVTFIDTADIYGAGHNEVLVGRGIAHRRDEVQLATRPSWRTTPPCATWPPSTASGGGALVTAELTRAGHTRELAWLAELGDLAARDNP